MTDDTTTRTSDEPAPVPVSGNAVPEFRTEQITVVAPETPTNGGKTLVFAVQGLPGVARETTVQAIDSVMADLREILVQAGMTPSAVPHFTIVSRFVSEMRILVDAPGNRVNVVTEVLAALMRVWVVSGCGEFFWAKLAASPDSNSA